MSRFTRPVTAVDLAIDVLIVTTFIFFMVGHVREDDALGAAFSGVLAGLWVAVLALDLMRGRQ